MKARIYRIFVTLILVILLAVISACREPSQGENNEPVKLSTPAVTISAEGLASWTAIANAVKYKVMINGQEREITGTSIQLSPNDTIMVKAIGDGEQYLDSNYSMSRKYYVAYMEGGQGFYIKDADIIQTDSTTRYTVYLTNEEAKEEKDVIAIRKSVLENGAWKHGNQTIAIRPSEDGWDLKVGSASITRGTFSYQGKTYDWLMAYQGTKEETNDCYNIGFAVAEDPEQEWIKVGDRPVIEFDERINGKGAGCYGPSLVNYNKQSGIRLFYTYGDIYGHYAYFWDADLANLENFKGARAVITNGGTLSGGDLELMMPNCDYVYDAENDKFYLIKDYSPSAVARPNTAIKIELGVIDEQELYTTEDLGGWESLILLDEFELQGSFERIYSGTIVSDAYGHLLSEDEIEIVYNICDTLLANPEYIFSQRLLSYTYTF